MVLEQWLAYERTRRLDAEAEIEQLKADVATEPVEDGDTLMVM
jgi:hypothetical protein